MRVRMLVAYDGSGFHGFAAQPGQRTVAGVLGGGDRARSPATRRTSPAPVAPTAACTRGGRSCRSTCRRSRRPRVAPAVPGEAVRARDRRARGRRGGSRLRRPLLGDGPHLPLHGAQPRRARSVPGDHVVARAGAARPRAAHAGVRPVPRRARLQRVLPAPQGGAGRGAGVAGAAGAAGRLDRPRRRSCSASRSRPTRSATRWSARSSAPSSRPVTRRSKAGDIRAILRGRRPGRRRPDRAAGGPLPVARFVLTGAWIRSTAWLIGCSSAEFARRHDLPDWRIC